LIAWCAIHSLCGNGHPGAAYWRSTAQLPDEFGLGARRCAAPSFHPPRLSATMAYFFVRSVGTFILLRCLIML
jgi:hypothetical protein